MVHQVFGMVPGTELVLLDGIMPKSLHKLRALSLATLVTAIVAPCFSHPVACLILGVFYLRQSFPM